MPANAGCKSMQVRIFNGGALNLMGESAGRGTNCRSPHAEGLAADHLHPLMPVPRRGFPWLASRTICSCSARGTTHQSARTASEKAARS